MKYYLIAGEASGDLHGSNLMKELKKTDALAQFRFCGGDLMKAQGGEMVIHYSRMSFMGLVEILMNSKRIYENFRICKKDLLENQPDAIILIDYPGFNFRMATFAKKHGIKVFYYISPHLWAWKKGRMKTIKKYFDKLFVILPFEVDFFKLHHCAVDFVGNPVADAVDDFKKNIKTDDFRQKNNLSEKPIVALLAGSRVQEIEKCLPEMLKTVTSYTDYQFVIAGAPSIHLSFYQKIIKDTKVALVQNQTYALLSNAHAAVVTSGTATLETALFNVPQIVIYKLNEISLFLARKMIKIKYFSLVNLIRDKPVVKELLQYNLSEGIRIELKLLLYDDDYRNRMMTEYELIRGKIGQHASQKTAQLIYKYLSS